MPMRHPNILALVCCCTFFTLPAAAFTTQQHDTVIRLGELNGVALQCGYAAEMRRMKTALIGAVPKVSQLGQLFEEATQKSFMAMVEKRQPCPNLAPFHGEVDRAVTALQQAFQPSKP